MKCWSPWCPSIAMCPEDNRVCWIHRTRYVLLGESLPLSVVPIQERIEHMMTRPHPGMNGRTWNPDLIAELGGTSRERIERMLAGRNRKGSLSLARAEQWADVLHVHPSELWGDVYYQHVQKVAA